MSSSSSLSLLRRPTSPPNPHRQTLVVDEMDIRTQKRSNPPPFLIPPSPSSPATSLRPSLIRNAALGGGGGGGSQWLGCSGGGGASPPCPCCGRCVESGMFCADYSRVVTAPSPIDSVIGDHTVGEEDINEDAIARGDYTVMEVLKEGWLHKKGTGNDWFGTRWWKPRWVTLAWAEVSGGGSTGTSEARGSGSGSGGAATTTITPVLIIQRASGIPYPASVIPLGEATVVMAIEKQSNEQQQYAKSFGSVARSDHDDGKEWNTHCFHVVHCESSANAAVTGGGGRSDINNDEQQQQRKAAAATRVFTASWKERNEWVFKISLTLMEYEKRLTRARRERSGAARRQISVDATASVRVAAVGASVSAGVKTPTFSYPQPSSPQPYSMETPQHYPHRARSPDPVRRRGGGGNADRHRRFAGLPPTSPKRVRLPSPTRPHPTPPSLSSAGTGGRGSISVPTKFPICHRSNVVTP